MPIHVIDNFNLASDIPLDIRYTADTYMDVSAYWYEGMQVYQYNDKQVWYYDGSTWSPLKQTGPINIDLINGGENWMNPSGDEIVGGTY